MPNKKRYILIPILLLLFVTLTYSVPTRQMHLSTMQSYMLNASKTASTGLMSQRFENEASFVSEVYEADFPFELLALTWAEELPEDTATSLEIRFRTKAGKWTDWESVHEDEDNKEKPQSNKKNTYFVTENSTAFQYRALLTTENKFVSPKLSDFSFDYIDGGRTSIVSKLARLTFNDDKIISRTEWGANESLRLAKNHTSTAVVSDGDRDLADPNKGDKDLDIVRTISADENGNELWWPLEFPKTVKKIVIHHTATSGDLDNPKAAIRAIYQYHSMTRGWGDIGYNYIIDPQGNIYKGRYGGDGVVAGHAAGYNTSTIGIALLGNYENEPIPAPMMQALMGLIYEKADLYGIDIDSYGKYKDKMIPNLLGHRDLAATACPGTYTYEYIPELRSIIGLAQDARRHTNTSSDFSYEEVGDRALVSLAPGESEQISIKIKNTGSATWDKNTFITVNANADGEKILNIAKNSQKRVALMKESSVSSGQSATFTFEVATGNSGGLASFDIAPVFNGTTKTNHLMDLAAYVEQPLLKYSVSSTSPGSSILKPGESTKVTVSMKNTGNISWTNSGAEKVTLRTVGSSDLVSTSTLATLKEAKINPGETGHFEFMIKAPGSGGKYTLYFAPSSANPSVIVKGSTQVSIQVLGSTEDATILDATNNLELKPGESKAIWLKIENSSNATWKKADFEVGITKSGDIKMTTPKLSVNTLYPGRNAKIFFSVTAPSAPGTYQIFLRPRLAKRNLTNSSYTLSFTVAEAKSIQAEEYKNPIRIKLTPDSDADPILYSASSFNMLDNGKNIKTFSEKSRVRITKQDGKFFVTSGMNSWTLSGPVSFVPASGGIMKILTMDQRPAWNTSLNDNSYRGTIEIRDVDGELAIINELPLEQYLLGLAEISNNDEPEKIKTIQVLARSYAWYYMTKDQKFPGKPYNLDDDPETSQKYLGYGYEQRSPNAGAQLAKTTGKIVTYHGEVVKTPYFSQSDGTKTKSANEVWGWTNTPWLVSVDDSICNATSFAGHGVGLSGCGATEMAKQGKTFEDIIRYYYKGVEIGSL